MTLGAGSGGLYLPYISPISPLYLHYIPPGAGGGGLYLPYISPISPQARVAAGTDALQHEGAGESLLTRLTGVRLRLAFYSVPMTKF